MTLLNRRFVVKSLTMFRDRTYFTNLFRIALPIIAQNLVTSLLNLIDITMIGQLGETSVAAVGLANQIYFLMILMLFGVNSGAGVFVAQLWGRRDIDNIHKVQGISLSMGLASSLLFSVVAVGFPEAAMRVYTEDPAVIAEGASYLRLVGWSYVATAVTISFSAVLRGIGMVRIPMFISIFAISLKTFLNYGLILGNLGMPALGVEGAAISTIVARVLEVLLLLSVVYLRKLPPAANLRELTGFTRAFLFTVLATSMPVVINETLWSLGITTYNAVYARISTEASAAMNISASIENLAFVFFMGISEACGILIGNRIGANQEDEAFLYASRTLVLGWAGAIFMGVLVWFGSDLILGLYNISPLARENAEGILRVMALLMWVRVINMLLIVGILRAGGDTRFGLVLDSGTIWLVGVPLAFFGAFVLRLPVYWVYALIMTEEMVKCCVAAWRFLSRRWMRNLAKAVS